MAYDDITRTGAQSFRDLQLANNKDFANAVTARKQELASEYNNYAKSREFDPYENAEQHIRSSLYGTPTAWGESSYDEPVANANQFEQLQDVRANNQQWYTKLAAGLVKGVGLAGTTFLDGTIGLVVGASEAIAQRDISKLWDNEISNGLHDFNKVMEEWLPNYRTEEEQNDSWYNNLGTINFWADSFLKNMGFTVGAFYSGGIWTKGLKGLGALTKALGAKTLGTAMQTNGLGAKLTGALFSAVNEGRIEANNTTSDLRDLQVQQASDAFAKRRQEIIDDVTLSADDKIAQMAELDDNYQATLDQIDDNLKKTGLTDFLINIPILAIDNFWTFGRMYAQGFSNARTVAGKNIKKSYLSRVSQAANKAADAADNTFAQNTRKEAGRFAWNEITKKQTLGKGIMIGLREGNEEMAQGWASEFAGNKAFYSDGPDTYYRAMSDPEALNNTMSSWEAVSKAFANTYGNADRYEEFAIGVLTGLLGTPTFGRSQNASANTWLGRGKMVGLSGGIFGEFKSDAEMNNKGYAHVTNMNAALDKRDQIDKTARIHAAMSQFNDVMDGFAEADDKFEYNNASDNLDWMGITSFISTGREEDLKTILGQDFDNISDKELESIAAFTAQNDESNTGGFREKGSGNIITADSPQSDKDEMRQKLKKTKEKILDEVDAYKTSVDIIRNYAAGNPNVTEEEINELAWMHWKTNRFNRRASEIKQDNAEQFTLIAQALEDFKKKQQEVIDRKEESTEGLSAASMSVVENRNTQLSKAKKDAYKNLEYADELLGIINSVAGTNKNVMPFLAPMLQMDKDFLDGVLKSDNFYNLAITRGLTKPEFDKVIRDIRDLGRLAEANKTFNNKLTEYMEDPFKQKKDHSKVDSENGTVSQEINKETNRKRAKKVTREQILNGEVNAEDVIKNTNTTDIERQLAQDAKVTLQVGQKVESLIAKQTQEGTLSDEDAAKIEAAIQHGIAQSKSINDLTGSNAAFMVDADGQLLSEEQIVLIQSLIDKATKETAEANGLNIKDGEIDFSKVEEAVQSQTGPTEEQAKTAEEAIAKEETKTTGNDAVEKAVAANSNGVQGDPEKAIRKGRPNRGSGKSQQRRKKNGNTSLAEQLKKSKKEKEAATKAAEEKARQEAITKKKNSIVSAALTFTINGNVINISTPEGQQETQLLSDILSKAYDLINEGKIEKLSSIIEVLKSMDEFEKLQQMLGRDPNLGSALKSISDNLNREFTPEDNSTDDAAELERILGPETTSNETASPASFSSQNLNPAINIPNYFAPATSQYYRDPKTGQILPVPFTAKMQAGNKARKKKLEATYNYLTQNEAFKNASRVKVGDNIYFTIHPNLNTAAGGIVILMSTDPEGKHIVGDLADTESYTYENNTLLKAMVDRITKEFNERKDKDSSEPFVSKETSTVRQSMVGHVMFTDSKNAAGDKTLNGVFSDGQFKMGVANRAGDIITTNQGDESVSGNLDIITPKTRFTPGTPVVLIPSGEGTSKYIAVPFQMSKYDSSMRDSKFHKYAEFVLKRVLLNKGGESIDLSSDKAQVLIKNALNALFNGDFHVNFTNGQLVIHQTIKTVKDGVTEKKNNILFRGTPNAGIVNSILNALQSKGMTIRIDRREINKDSNLKDLDFSYNTMIGDLAHTNLSDKSSITVNDWFIVNPVNEKGEEININRVEYRDTRTEKTPAQRNDTKVTYKGKEYLVSEEDIVVDKNGNPRTDINVTDQQIILAKAEIEKNDLAAPIGTEGEQIFWYSLGNGNLFYNKDGEERVVVSETDKQAVKDSLTIPKETPATTTSPVSPAPTTETPAVTESSKTTVPEPSSQKSESSIINQLSNILEIAKQWNAQPLMDGVNPSVIGMSTSVDLINNKINQLKQLLSQRMNYENMTRVDSLLDDIYGALNTMIDAHRGKDSNNAEQLIREVASTIAQAFPIDAERYIKSILAKAEMSSIPGRGQVSQGMTNTNNIYIDGNYLWVHSAFLEQSLSTPSGPKSEMPKEEPAKNKYPTGFNSQDQKDFFNAMSKERQKLLMNANPNAISAIIPYINSVMHDFGIEDLDEAEDDIDDIFDKLTSTKYRAIDEVEEYAQADIEDEKEWLKKALPQLSDEDHFRIINGLIKITRKDNPGYAYGKTQQGIMTISDAAATGTVYHEAFHSVIDVLLTDEEVNSLFKSGAKKYGIERSNLDNELAIEENLAEDFRRYVQRERAYKKELEQSSGLSRIFKILKHTAKTWLDNTSYINNMFYRINQGQLANRSLRDNRKAERYNQYTAEEKAILDKAPRDSEGRLLAPNGRVSNLTEKQYAQVRTRAFKDWFGDWENNPSEASKVVDENGEPLVVYHTRDAFKGKDFNIFNTTIENRETAIYATNDRRMSSSYWKFGNNRKALANLYTLSLVGDINKVDTDPFTGEPFKNSESYHYTKLIKLLNELGIEIDDTKNTYTQNEIKTIYNNLKEQAELEDLKSLFVNIKNPLIIEGNDAYWNEIIFGKETLSTREIENRFRNSEYDGIIFKNIKDWGGYNIGDVSTGNVYASYNANQVKSATDNIGTFDANNPNIRYREATITSEDIQQYHREKLDYSNLDNTQKALLEDRGISEEQYSFLTQAEKENLRMCLI